MPLEEDVKTITASLSKVNDQLKAHAEQAQKDLKAHQEMSAESKAKVDQLLVQQGELQADLRAAQQAIVKLENGGGTPAAPKSLGEIVAEAEQVKAFNTGMQGSVSVKVGSIHAAVTSNDASAGELIQPTRLPGILMPPQQRLFLRDLLNWGRTSSNSIEYVREKGFTNNANVVSENPANPKPESDITFELDQAPIVTIAHWIRASKQVLADAAMLQAYIC